MIPGINAKPAGRYRRYLLMGKLAPIVPFYNELDQIFSSSSRWLLSIQVSGQLFCHRALSRDEI